VRLSPAPSEDDGLSLPPASSFSPFRLLCFLFAKRRISITVLPEIARILRIQPEGNTKKMTEADKQEVKRIVQDEILGILADAKALLGGKDPTGFGKKALDGLASVIRLRQTAPGQGNQRPG
jgi:hypothetical protein